MGSEAQHIGTYGEAVARRYLEKLGLRFVVANWLCRAGEIDLVMRDGSTLVFVEVRLRAPTVYGEGFMTVNTAKQRKLIAAARHYQQREDWWGDVRFDVVSIVAAAGSDPQVTHIAHAFEA